MPQTFQLRRGTTEEWAFANPILQAGELGLNTSVNRIKVGDGVTKWSSLSYITNNAALVANLGSVDLQNIGDGDVLRWSGGAWRNYSDRLLVDGGNF